MCNKCLRSTFDYFCVLSNSPSPSKTPPQLYLLRASQRRQCCQSLTLDCIRHPTRMNAKHRTLAVHSVLILSNLFLLARLLSSRSSTIAYGLTEHGDASVLLPDGSRQDFKTPRPNPNNVINSSRLRGGAPGAFDRRVLPQKQAPERYKYPSDDGANCCVCYFPHVCIREGIAYMPPSSRTKVYQLASQEQCSLTVEQSRVAKKRVVRFSGGLEIRFDKVLRIMPFSLSMC
jgi:hypothetical protein